MEREEYIYPYEESFEGKADFQIQNLENAILKVPKVFVDSHILESQNQNPLILFEMGILQL